MVVMRLHTPALTALGPGTLNSPASKATFYIFHAAPEFLAGAAFFVVNVKELCETGLFGDWRMSDEEVPQVAERDVEVGGEKGEIAVQGSARTSRDSASKLDSKNVVQVEQVSA